MINIIIIAVILGVVSGIILYLIRQKRKGIKCVGCPYAKECKNTACGCEKHKNIR